MRALASAKKPLHIPSLAAALPPAWQWYRLDAVCEGIFDCPHSTPELTDAGPYVVRTQDILSGVFRVDQAAHVSDETYQERIRRAQPRFGDLLYSREGTYFGIAAEIPRQTRLCLGQQMVMLRPDPQTISTRFLKYWLNSSVLASHVEGLRDGSVAERLNMPTIRGLPVLLPPLRQQIRIGEILGTLDDKIELNRRMNETLEAMARALFKSWFVDFDPVRAKLEGRQPAGMDPATAALFPDSFQDSPLGRIPSGWASCSFADHVAILSGGTPRTSVENYWGGETPWYTVKDAPAESDVWVLQTQRTLTQHGLANSAAEILSEKISIVSARGTVGRVALLGVPMAINQSCYGVQAKNGYSPLFTFYNLKAATETLQRHTHGTVFDTITRETFNSLRRCFPPARLTQAFDVRCSPLLERIRLNLFEVRCLAGLRDTLSPKLLSGRVAPSKVDFANINSSLWRSVDDQAVRRQQSSLSIEKP